MGKTKKKSGFDLFSILYKNSLLVEGIVIFAIFGIASKGTFLSVGNLSNLIMQGATCAIISITMCLVIITCNADLSAGRLLGMLCMIAAMIQVLQPKIPSWVVLILIYALAVGIGLIHGFFIGYLKLPAFIITLSTQLVFLGVSQYISKGRIYGPVGGVISKIGAGYLPACGDPFNIPSVVIGAAALVFYVIFTINKQKKAIAQGYADKDSMKKVVPRVIAVAVAIAVVTIVLALNKGFAYAMIIMTVLTIIVAYISNNSKFGRYIYAIGGNVNAAALSGINVPKETLKLYVLHSVVVATAAMVYLGRMNSATTSAGMGYEFTAITGCVVGGTAITGGRGTVGGAVIGTIVMAALDNGMSVLNMDPALQYVVRGAVLLFAISLDSYANNRKAKTVL